MPAPPNLVERFLLLRLGKAPAPVFDVLASASTRAVDVARELDVFEALGDGAMPIPQLADATGTSTAGLEALVPVLVSLGYVERDGDAVANTELTQRWFLEESQEGLTRWAKLWSDVVYPYWDEHLVEAIEAGAPSKSLYAWCDEEPERWRVVQEAFLEPARLVADEIVDRIEVPEGASSLLDVGGGHGLHAMRLVEAHEDLQATVLDRAPALEQAAGLREERSLVDRVRLEPGDYLADDLGTGWDVALLFNVLHGHDTDEARGLVDRVADALAPGGRIYVLDQFETRTIGPMTEAAIRLIGLNYFVTLGGRIHDADEVRRWLADAGLVDVDEARLKTAPGLSLIEARGSRA